MRAAAVCLCLAAVPAQAPQPVATFVWNGEERCITSDDVALEMAPRHRRTPRGEETIAHLIDLHLVRTAAEGKGLLPTDAEVQAQLAAYRAEIKAQGRDPDKFLQSKGVTESELADYTVLTLALDRLVAQQLGLGGGQVTNEYRELWLKDAKKVAEIVTDEAALPAGIVARAGGRQFTLLDLGRVLFARASHAERNRFARQVALRRLLDEEAKARGITVTAADCDAAVTRIRERAERDNRDGVTFTSMLEALGTNASELADSAVLRAQVIARQIVAARWPDAVVHERLAKEGDDIRARFGARRRVEVLWLRASATPNQLVPRSFEAAAEEAQKVRAKLDTGTTFAMLARVHSDDPRTKLKGGDSGWHHRASKGLPGEVLSWAFAAKPDDVSAPIRVSDGVCLARVAAIEPEPPFALLRARLLDDFEEEFYRELLQKAAIKMREGT